MTIKNISIIGAGLTGSLLAIFLAKRGYQIQVFEKRPDMRIEKVEAGRSINLAISCRGLNALDAVGLKESIESLIVPMQARMVHDSNGQCHAQTYGIDETEKQGSISRTALNKHLLSAAENLPNIKLFFNQQLSDINLQQASFNSTNTLSNISQPVKADLLIGADGVNSVIRQTMEQIEHTTTEQSTTAHRYKELHIPAELGQQLARHYLHIWPRESFMLIALPNTDGSFTCTLFLAANAAVSFAQLNNDQAIEDFFQTHFADVLPLLPNLLHDFHNNPCSKLNTTLVSPWHYQNKALLIGDAAHGMVPFLGQGMNCAFEDCFVFDQLLAEYGAQTKGLCQAFYQQRKANADAICQLALDNYHEMADSVAKKDFILQKQVEKSIEKRYPHEYISRYRLISFSNHSYQYAQYCGELQTALLEKICQTIQSADELDWQKVELNLLEYQQQLEQFTEKSVQ